MDKRQIAAPTPEVTVSKSLSSAVLEEVGLSPDAAWKKKGERLKCVTEECQRLLSRPAIENLSALEPADFENWLNHPLMAGPTRERLLALIDDIPGLSNVLNQPIDSGEALQKRYRASMQILFAGGLRHDDAPIIMKGTLEQLNLHNVPFPNWFVPRYFVKELAEGYDGCCFVHDEKPYFENGEWKSSGSTYEIGVSETDLDNPAYCRGLSIEEFLFEIVDT